MTRFLNTIIFLKSLFIVLFILIGYSAKSENIKPTEQAKFSILTCTPGADLYSLFGHTAIRFQDIIDGHIVDWVYNYGTFEFDDSFYWKFARGKLDYILSKEDFPYFQYGYIQEGRGIFEQELLLSSEERMQLFNLLEENYLPQNRTYRYDFFYDNCSTRVRDIINKATGNNLSFNYSYSKEYTFRDAIQTYLNYQPWSDLGIDIALGIPCDYKVEKTQMMFLPDSLMTEFNYAEQEVQKITLPQNEILPAEYIPSNTTFFTPVVVFFIFLVAHLFIGFFCLKKKINFQITDRILLFSSGLVGLLVIFLWFFTDHTATAWNLNILWANPLNILLSFSFPSKGKKWMKKYITIYLAILILTLISWFFLPQRMHLSLIPIVIGLIFTCIKLIRPQFLSKSTQIHTV